MNILEKQKSLTNNFLLLTALILCLLALPEVQADTFNTTLNYTVQMNQVSFSTESSSFSLTCGSNTSGTHPFLLTRSITQNVTTVFVQNTSYSCTADLESLKNTTEKFQQVFNQSLDYFTRYADCFVNLSTIRTLGTELKNSSEFYKSKSETCDQTNTALTEVNVQLRQQLGNKTNEAAALKTELEDRKGSSNTWIIVAIASLAGLLYTNKDKIGKWMGGNQSKPPEERTGF